MKKLSLGSFVGDSVEAKVDWCVSALRKIESASHDVDVFDIANNFATENVTQARTLDADAVDVAELADIVGTLLDDLKKRGSKGIGR